VPGAAGPQDDLVERLHRQIQAYGDGAVVEVELRDGTRLELASISPEPGYGFVTLRPHPEDEPPSEVIVPVGAIARITISKLEPEQPFGFRLPAA
jgi:hypothetical protein